MKLIFNCLLVSLALGLSGCGSITYERATFDGARISNPTLGRGVYYQLPPAYSVLNPYSPVPTRPENAGFETYLRRFAVRNDQMKTDHAFRETILFRGESRYLFIFHASLNLPGTFRGMHPARRTLLMPMLAAESYRYFDVPQRDFDYAYEQINGRTAIVYKPFHLESAGSVGADWRGIGCTVLGDATDIMTVHLFARESDLAAAQQDLRFILEHFSYGKALP